MDKPVVFIHTRQETFFFSPRQECLDCGELSNEAVHHAVTAGDVRPDVFDCLAAAGHRQAPAT